MTYIPLQHWRQCWQAAWRQCWQATMLTSNVETVLKAPKILSNSNPRLVLLPGSFLHYVRPWWNPYDWLSRFPSPLHLVSIWPPCLSQVAFHLISHSQNETLKFLISNRSSFSSILWSSNCSFSSLSNSFLIDGILLVAFLPIQSNTRYAQHW